MLGRFRGPETAALHFLIIADCPSHTAVHRRRSGLSCLPLRVLGTFCLNSGVARLLKVGGTKTPTRRMSVINNELTCLALTGCVPLNARRRSALSLVTEHFLLGPRWHRGVHPLFRKFLTGFRPFQKPTFVSGWGYASPQSSPWLRHCALTRYVRTLYVCFPTPEGFPVQAFLFLNSSSQLL